MDGGLSVLCPKKEKWGNGIPEKRCAVEVEVGFLVLAVESVVWQES